MACGEDTAIHFRQVNSTLAAIFAPPQRAKKKMCVLSGNASDPNKFWREEVFPYRGLGHPIRADAAALL